MSIFVAELEAAGAGHLFKTIEDVEDTLNYRVIRGKAYVNDLSNELVSKTDVTERVLDAFAAQGIESPAAPVGVGPERTQE